MSYCHDNFQKHVLETIENQSIFILLYSHKQKIILGNGSKCILHLVILLYMKCGKNKHKNGEIIIC